MVKRIIDEKSKKKWNDFLLELNKCIDVWN